MGVDVFVFLSGFGLFYSLSSSNSIKQFYQKRFHRVLLPYLVWGLFFWIIKDFILTRKSFLIFLYDFSLLSFWGSGIQTFWYIAFISLLYVIAPLLFKATRTKNEAVLCTLALSLVSVICYFLSKEYYSFLEIAFQRLPHFMIGMYCGKLAKGDRKISGKLIIVLSFSVPVKIVLGVMDFPFARLFNGYYAIFLIVLYILVRSKMGEKCQTAFLRLSKVGEISLELYIVHIGIRNLMGTMQLPTWNLFLYLSHLIVVVPLALVLARIQDRELLKLK